MACSTSRKLRGASSELSSLGYAYCLRRIAYCICMHRGIASYGLGAPGAAGVSDVRVDGARDGDRAGVRLRAGLVVLLGGDGVRLQLHRAACAVPSHRLALD